jgi:hypothetical protein
LNSYASPCPRGPAMKKPHKSTGSGSPPSDLFRRPRSVADECPGPMTRADHQVSDRVVRDLQVCPPTRPEASTDTVWGCPTRSSMNMARLDHTIVRTSNPTPLVAHGGDTELEFGGSGLHGLVPACATVLSGSITRWRVPPLRLRGGLVR